MDETRWLSCDDPRKLLVWLRGVASDRKLRLFACAFWRGWWFGDVEHLPDGDLDPELLDLLTFAEQWAESGVRPKGAIPLGFRWHPLVARDARDAANWTIRETAGSKERRDCLRRDPKNRAQAAGQQVLLLRDIFGNPFRPVTIDRAWLTPTVVALARTVYDGRTFDCLPILADALEDAGCNDEAVLSHGRDGGQHVRGCWLLDLVLGTPLDPTLLDVCCDVVIRFKGHGSYKGITGALKAIARRASGFSPEQYQAAFGLLCSVYDWAVEAIQRHPAERPAKQSRFAEFEDIDFNACMTELETIEPDVATKEKKELLQWVIFWHYLK